jgi:hypothetical protein
MKNITKKIIIYSMVGMMQVGLSTAILEASPNNDFQQQLNDQNAQENQRHEQEMKQRPGENQKQLKDRQATENQRHNQYTKQGTERQNQDAQENQRHEQEMKQRPGENQKQLKDRQAIENQRHNQYA